MLKCSAARGMYCSGNRRRSARYINDVNRNLVCFFAVVKDKDKCGVLYEKLSSTLHSRDVFDRCLSNLKLEVISDIERAYCFAVVNKQSFGSMMET